jgi:hypothetical protein
MAVQDTVVQACSAIVTEHLPKVLCGHVTGIVVTIRCVITEAECVLKVAQMDILVVIQLDGAKAEGARRQLSQLKIIVTALQLTIGMLVVVT